MTQTGAPDGKGDIWLRGNGSVRGDERGTRSAGEYLVKERF